MPETNRRVRRRIYYAQSLAYVLIILIAIVGFVDARETQREMCEGGRQNRLAIRTLTSEIAALGEDLVVGDRPRDQITPDQQAAIDRFQVFKAAQLQRLPLPICSR
jgi:hypothetical protein